MAITVDAVVLTLEYRRSFEDDCAHCEDIDKYEDQTHLVAAVEGVISPHRKEKLFKFAMHRPVRKMLLSGIKVVVEPG